jgi:hypothetical protein
MSENRRKDIELSFFFILILNTKNCNISDIEYNCFACKLFRHQISKAYLKFNNDLLFLISALNRPPNVVCPSQRLSKCINVSEEWTTATKQNWLSVIESCESFRGCFWDSRLFEFSTWAFIIKFHLVPSKQSPYSIP